MNIDLTQDAFVVKAKKGTLIVDSRNEDRKNVFASPADIDDVVAAFPVEQ